MKMRGGLKFRMNPEMRTTLVTDTTPSARRAVSFTYDEVAEVGVLFGGYAAVSPEDDAWAFAPGAESWAQKTAAAEIANRAWHAAFWDHVNSRVMVHGGETSFSGTLSDLSYTENQGANWSTHDFGVATQPAGRKEHAIAVDRDNNVAVLYGGSNGGWSAETYELALGVGTYAWTLIGSSEPPGGLRNHCMAYDRNTGKILLYGGTSGPAATEYATWRYQVGSGWDAAAVNVAGEATPGTDFRATDCKMVWSSELSRVILITGEDAGGGAADRIALFAWHDDIPAWRRVRITPTWGGGDIDDPPTAARQLHGLIDVPNIGMYLTHGQLQSNGANKDETWRIKKETA